MEYIIDRIEGDIAVCELKNEKFLNIKIANLPEGIKEGDVLSFKNGKYEINDKKTKERQKHIENITKDLWI